MRSSKKNTMLQKSEDIGTEKEREKEAEDREKRKIHYYYCCRFFSSLFMENGSSKEGERETAKRIFLVVSEKDRSFF